MMMTIEELIAALEAATGPSRELDAAIWRHIGLTSSDEAHCVDWCANGGRTDLTRGRYIAAWARPYTASIDAALTLVPEGHYWQLEAGGEAAVYDTQNAPQEALHKSPAIALCIAALKARAAQ